MYVKKKLAFLEKPERDVFEEEKWAGARTVYYKTVVIN